MVGTRDEEEEKKRRKDQPQPRDEGKSEGREGNVGRYTIWVSASNAPAPTWCGDVGGPSLGAAIASDVAAP